MTGTSCTAPSIIIIIKNNNNNNNNNNNIVKNNDYSVLMDDQLTPLQKAVLHS